MNKKLPGSARRQHERVTATDVARLAGVSPMTVSRVINGVRSVRPSTRAAVQQAIERLGYSPNKAARSLASGGQMKMGLLSVDPNSTYLGAILLGALEQARQSDTQLVIIEYEPEADSDELLESIGHSDLNGLMVAPPVADDPAFMLKLTPLVAAVATIGTRAVANGISSVYVDDYRAAHAMACHIIGLGHRRIGFIRGGAAHLSSRLREDGYRDAMVEAGLEVEEELIVEGLYSYRSGLDATDYLLSLQRPPTAIFASNDDMAAAAIATAHRHSIEVPAGLTVCGYDDTFLATTVWPEITTIHQPLAQMARRGLELLEAAVRNARNDSEPTSEQVEFPFQLVKRQSDGPPPARLPDQLAVRSRR